MENENDNQDLSLEQYKAYMDLLRQTSLQRAVSNYFFIAVNIAILLSSWVILSFVMASNPYSFGNVSSSFSGTLYFLTFANLSILGAILSLYWYQESRESFVLNEVRYRTLIEIESRLFKKGIFNYEWNKLGDYKFRRSPVFFVSLGRLLPLIFAAMQLINLIIWWNRFGGVHLFSL